MKLLKNRNLMAVVIIHLLSVIAASLIVLTSCKEDPPPPPDSGVEDRLDLHQKQIQVLDTNDSILVAMHTDLATTVLGVVTSVDSVLDVYRDKIQSQNARISSIEARRDTIYLTDEEGVEKRYIVSYRPLPPSPPQANRAYVDTVVMENDYWVYYLYADSLEISWDHDHRDINGAVITKPLWFHIAYVKEDGTEGTLKPNPRFTQDTKLVMKGLPAGELISPSVAAYIVDDDGDWIYSPSWIESRDYGWKVRAR